MLPNSLLSFISFIPLLLHIRDLHLYFDVNWDSCDPKGHFRRWLEWPGWQWMFQLILFQTAKGLTLGETAGFAFSSISFKRFQIAGLASFVGFFTARQTLKGTENCRYSVFPPRGKQLRQTEILLFADKVKSLTWPGICTFNMPGFLFSNILWVKY